MSAKNIHHAAVIEALKNDGWTITHDPLRLSFADVNMYVDLGAEQITLGAERGTRRIAVEIQSFLGNSPVRALQEALGQFALYRAVLSKREPERQLYVAVTDEVHTTLLSGALGQLVISEFRLRLIAFNPETRGITRWIE